MPFKLIAPVEKEFTLDRADKFYGVTGSPTRVIMRQASQLQKERRDELFATLTREYDGKAEDVVRYVQRFSLSELMRMEVYLSLVGANLEDENGRPMFRKGMSEQDFNRAWGKLPPDVCAEIHEKVYEVNPTWNPLYNPPLPEEEPEPEPESSE